jgi:pimeloyl-ACP methyl ester carboxylesterase
MIVFWVVLLVIVATPLAVEYRRKPMDADARRNAPGEFATLSQGVTHYEWLGPLRGPVAVCVHGQTTPSFVWHGLARGLVEMGYRVLVYDIYGRGYSDRPKGLQDQAFFQRQLDDLLKDQQVGDDFTLLGYSMGGAIVTAYTAAHPDRVRQMVLLAPGGVAIKLGLLTRIMIKTPLIGDWLILALFPRQHQKSTEAERKLHSSVENIVDLQQRELQFKGFTPAVLSSLRGLLSGPLQAEHRAIHTAGVPVLAIWARDDALIPMSAMGTLTEWSRSARQDVVDGAGHGLPYTHTEEVLAIMREALRDGLN